MMGCAAAGTQAKHLSDGHTARTRTRLSIAPTEKIGLSRFEAAAFIGVTPTSFDALVRTGDMPSARRLGNVLRWDRRQIEVAFSMMPQDDKIVSLSAYSDVA